MIIPEFKGWKPMFDWELKESDITSEMCKKCTKTDLNCCQLAVQSVPHQWSQSRQQELLKTMIENIPELHIRDNGELVLTCSHLKNQKCDIYEDRPQLCRDYNCVTWARVSGNLDQYKKVLKIKKENEGTNANV